MLSNIFTLQNKQYSNKNVFIIAEIGTGHGGNLNKAKELVEAALTAGSDCVKFQHVYADEIIHPNTGFVPLPGGNIPLYERFKNLEVNTDFLLSIKEYTEKLGGVFLCTPFGIKSALDLESIFVSAYKIASPELNYCQLIKKIFSFNKPTILSSGVSKLCDIESALEYRQYFEESKTYNPQTALLHCITSYPAPETEYNLSILKTFSTLFDIAVGVSDHSCDPILVPTLALSCGAAIIEKHICLSKSDDGLDDPIALTSKEFKKMVLSVRKAEKMTESEIISYMESIYGKDKIKQVLGNGQKHLAYSEKNNYGKTNRSLHALCQINKGDILTEKNVAILRTEKILKPGLAPCFFETIIGKKAKKDIPSGEGISWEDLL